MARVFEASRRSLRSVACVRACELVIGLGAVPSVVFEASRALVSETEYCLWRW